MSGAYGARTVARAEGSNATANLTYGKTCRESELEARLQSTQCRWKLLSSSGEEKELARPHSRGDNL